MTKIIPPLCLVLGLFSFVAGFALLAVDPPQPGMELHGARVEGDDQYRDLLEDQLERRQLRRNVLIGALFACSVLFPTAGFLAMQPTRPLRDTGNRSRKSDGQEN